MKKILLGVAAALVFSAVGVRAEVGVSNQTLGTSSLGPLKENTLDLSGATPFKGLLDTNRLSFQHSVGISFRSGTRGGLNQHYLNTITYQVAEPLVIQAQVGLENNLYGKPAFSAPSSSGSTRLIVPYVGLLYQPNPNVRIEIQFSNTPSYYGYTGYRGGYPY